MEKNQSLNVTLKKSNEKCGISVFEPVKGITHFVEENENVELQVTSNEKFMFKNNILHSSSKQFFLLTRLQRKFYMQRFYSQYADTWRRKGTKISYIQGWNNIHCIGSKMCH